MAHNWFVRLADFTEIKDLELRHRELGFGSCGDVQLDAENENLWQDFRDVAQRSVFGTTWIDLALIPHFAQSFKPPTAKEDALLFASERGFDLRADDGAPLRDWCMYSTLIAGCVAGLTQRSPGQLEVLLQKRMEARLAEQASEFLRRTKSRR